MLYVIQANGVNLPYGNHNGVKIRKKVKFIYFNVKIMLKTVNGAQKRSMQQYKSKPLL